ncbi:MAG: metal-dependent hydrolase [Heliobacteriaceae bacterium]|nr:metal-dependent hydrolase [Heliobacteriaceae bacterium]
MDDGRYKVLIDPFFTGNPVCPDKAGEVTADFILVTHGHGDHLGDAVAIAKRTGALIIAPNEVAVYCGQKGANAHGMHIGGKRDFPFGRVRLTPAFHGSDITEGDKLVPGGMPCGFLINMGGKTVYHAGDTSLYRDMELVNMCYLRGTQLDLALLPIGDNFVMGPDDAIFAVKWLHPKTVIPMHYNTWPVIEQDPVAFKKAVNETADVDCRILAPGDTFNLE